jgi:hypothetical protein
MLFGKFKEHRTGDVSTLLKDCLASRSDSAPTARLKHLGLWPQSDGKQLVQQTADPANT